MMNSTREFQYIIFHCVPWSETYLYQPNTVNKVHLQRSECRYLTFLI